MFCFVLFFSFIVADFFSLMQCLQLPFMIRVEEAVSWTQRFLQETFCPQKTRATEPPCQHFIGRTTQQTFLVINLASEQEMKKKRKKKKEKEKGKKALLFFSGKKTVQNFNGSVWTITPLFCEVIISRIDLVTDFQRYLDE